jgi:undecaprenyl-phosphate 4-deoxy-4-formamido-L-arabinose transferase
VKEPVVESAHRRSLSVVVPVYNSEGAFPQLVSRLAEALPGIALHYQLIAVNDGSRDGSWKAIRAQAERHPWIRGIDLMRNYGQHNAVLCGVRAAANELIVTMDDDLQNPPEEIHKLLEALEEGQDVVYGVPEKQRHGLMRNLASILTKAAMKVALRAHTAPDISAFRAFRTRLRVAFDRYRSPFANVDVLLTWGTTRFGTVRVRHDARPIGVSQYGFGKLLRHAFNMITGFSTLPLRVASALGFVFTLFGAGVLVYVLGRYLLLGYSVPGFPFLASVIAIFSGVQLFSLGIIGEYLARVHLRTQDRPLYAVRETTDDSGAGEP